MKYERKCSNCGRVDHYYAKGLCRTCYERLRRNGTFETQYKRGIGSRPYMWSDKTKRILELYRCGMRQVDIVKEVGLTKQEISIVIKKYVKPTNADRIRAMSDEELAVVIAWPYLASPPWCGEHTTCPYIGEDPTPCDKCALDWLKQEGNP